MQKDKQGAFSSLKAGGNAPVCVYLSTEGLNVCEKYLFALRPAQTSSSFFHSHLADVQFCTGAKEVEIYLSVW